MKFNTFIPPHLWRRWLARNRPDTQFGYVTSPLLEESFPEACRRLGVTPLKAPRRHWRFAHSCGAPVENSDGLRCWLKVTGWTANAGRHSWERETAAAGITGVPKPEVLGTADWNSNETNWAALLFTLAPSPTVKLDGWPIGLRTTLSDAWLSELKISLEALARVETDEWRISHKQIAKKIATHFGPDVPLEADEWRTCHGDLVATNLTAPNLMLLDWERWGLAPRGFDPARLLTSVVAHSDMVRRIENMFVDDLLSPSGRVALLLACAERLDAIGMGHVPFYRARQVKALAERALRGELGIR